MLQAQLFERGQGWVEELRGLQTKLSGLHNKLLEELKSIDNAWGANPNSNDRAVLLNRREELYRLLGYFNRWSSQIQERVVHLSL